MLHGKYQGRESKAELIIENGKVIKIRIKSVKGKAPLSNKELKYFEEFVEAYADKIVQNWIDYFVLHKEISCEDVERRVI